MGCLRLRERLRDAPRLRFQLKLRAKLPGSFGSHSGLNLPVPILAKYIHSECGPTRISHNILAFKMFFYTIPYHTTTKQNLLILRLQILFKLRLFRSWSRLAFDGSGPSPVPGGWGTSKGILGVLTSKMTWRRLVQCRLKAK